jgi:hypothetical protein
MYAALIGADTVTKAIPRKLIVCSEFTECQWVEILYLPFIVILYTPVEHGRKISHLWVYCLGAFFNKNIHLKGHGNETDFSLF